MRIGLFAVIAYGLVAGGGASIGRAESPKTHTVTMTDMRFEPATVTVAPGDLMIWVNKDIVDHTATAEGTFDSGVIAAGKSWSYRVRRKDDYTYVCTLHPTMKGVLRVR
jgi:plastocyanin